MMITSHHHLSHRHSTPPQHTSTPPQHTSTHPTADAELVELARDEAQALTKQLDVLEEQLKVLLLPKDPLDDKNIMLEVCGG